MKKILISLMLSSFCIFPSFGMEEDNELHTTNHTLQKQRKMETVHPWFHLPTELQKKIIGHLYEVDSDMGWEKTIIFFENFNNFSLVSKTIQVLVSESGKRIDELDFSLVNFNRDKMTDEKLEKILTICPNIQKLRLTGYKNITDKSLESIGNLKKLVFFAPYNNIFAPCDNITDTDFLSSTALVNLRTLDVYFSVLRDDRFINFKNLTSLALTVCQDVTGAGFVHLSNLSTLKLSRCIMIDNNSLAHLKSAKNLTSLDLSYINLLDDMGLVHLSSLVNLTSLNFSCINLTNAGLGHLIHIKKLTSLGLENCAWLTNACLTSISSLVNLTSLNLKLVYDIQDTELLTLKSLENLKNLSVQRVRRSDIGKKEVKKAFPNTKISWG